LSPHKKLFNGIRWGPESRDALTHESSAPPPSPTHTHVRTLDFPHTYPSCSSLHKYTFALTDTRCYVSAVKHTHTHTHIDASVSALPHTHSYTLLILLSSCWCVVRHAGRPYTEMSARQGAGTRGSDQWSHPPPPSAATALREAL